MNFSFFRRLRYAGNEIRGTQMATHLNGKLDPVSGYENDICIYILGGMRYDGPEVEHSYYDVMDCGLARLARVRRRTKGSLIAISRTQLDELCRTFSGREVYYIPQHHCNFDEESRPEREIRTVGCCGGDSAIQWPHDRVRYFLELLGLKWKFYNVLVNRNEVVEFYKDLDIQIVYRPTHNRGSVMMLHSNPLKLCNAGSFGIPTVAYPEPAFTAEWKDECLYSDGMEGIINLVRKLKEEPNLYKEVSEKAREKSKGYHISNIANLYRGLI